MIRSKAQTANVRSMITQRVSVDRPRGATSFRVPSGYALTCRASGEPGNIVRRVINGSATPSRDAGPTIKLRGALTRCAVRADGAGCIYEPLVNAAPSCPKSGPSFSTRPLHGQPRISFFACSFFALSSFIGISGRSEMGTGADAG